MAGIYLHIPFCKQACSYCNFHFSTFLKYKESVLNAMHRELDVRKYFFPNKTPVETIYFGGGTPSLLSTNEINAFTDHIRQLFTVADAAEITLEANPDDLTTAYLSELKKRTIVNRFSIGIQSFAEEDLRYMNRAHNAQEAMQCIRHAQQAGFDNLSVDLIYGTPTLSNEQWRKHLQMVFELNIPHISCYALTLEEKTALKDEIKNQKKPAPEDDRMTQQFSILLEEMNNYDYTHYEISNFCKQSHFAKHNTNYWKGIPYLGIGPGAHSYDGRKRYWNIANNPIYVKKISENQPACESECLSITDRFNEYIMTSIRTMFGVDSNKVRYEFGESFLQHFLIESSPFIDNKWIHCRGNIYTLTDSGKLFCDYITENLFIVEH